ncbi:4-(cytidine 5'-diphospho)-2-C-methyl-D-erythritol kinase [Wenxinia marina]|uniref:4-(cytidine 5'-diphospho)-2-C-methyl-D-erythritol kinase n=1 Tax=Wenxinia marina TaxID=390641 RepID=UPI0035714D93
MPSGFAPAKVNLALHVTGRRAGGYHELDSLVVFAGIGDQLSAVAAPDLSLTVEGPFSAGVPTDGTNSVMRAARALAQARGVRVGARLKLTKTLPHAAGLGSASSDAAAAIRLLAGLWNVTPFAPDDPEVVALGADVPVCLAAPGAQWMTGIGERLAPAGPLPGVGLVLVNPNVAVPTGDVFARLERSSNPPLTELPADRAPAAFAEWVAAQRNDLAPPAQALAPEIGRVLERLRRQPGILAAQMTGSGATCVGITKDVGAARQAARVLQLSEQSWWVVPAPILN